MPGVEKCRAFLFYYLHKKPVLYRKNKLCLEDETSVYYIFILIKLSACGGRKPIVFSLVENQRI